ncbi:uncharacterized protein LOC143285872 [Babylonia areolata]|uniref:uncharacterized protein LOC143285872 n=1 Tax=Babylonia areolata TaxID=304850 RepID=UPI003FCF4341
MTKLFLWCLLLLATAYVSQPAAVAPAEEDTDDGMTEDDVRTMVQSDDGSLVKESSTMMDNDGEVNETSVMDQGCTFGVTVASTNDSNSTVVDDMEDGVELALTSSVPGVCYVVRVPGEKRACQDGYTVNKDKVDDYKEGRNLSLSDLPKRLQKMCKGRTVTELVAAEDSSTSEGEDTSSEEGDASPETRRKRACTWIVIIRIIRVYRIVRICNIWYCRIVRIPVIIVVRYYRCV